MQDVSPIVTIACQYCAMVNQTLTSNFIDIVYIKLEELLKGVL